jgi:hypothetical protein
MPSAVNQHGHPDEVPIDALVKLGIDHETADKCMALLTSEDFPGDPVAAVAKWVRLVGEFSA